MPQLYMKYGGDKFVLIRVHTPEFAYDKVPANVMDGVKRFRIECPVAMDGENVTWKL